MTTTSPIEITYGDISTDSDTDYWESSEEEGTNEDVDKAEDKGQELKIMRLWASLQLDVTGVYPVERVSPSISDDAIRTLDQRYYSQKLDFSQLSEEEQDLSRRLFTRSHGLITNEECFGCQPAYKESPENVKKMLELVFFKTNEFSFSCMSKKELLHRLECCTELQYVKRIGVHLNDFEVVLKSSMNLQEC